MPLTYVVNVYSDMRLSEGRLGSRGESICCIFPMKNVTILGVFRMHAQKECGKALGNKEHSYPEHLAL